MARIRIEFVATAAALCLVAGCGSAPAARTETGARTAALRFYDAVIAQDWAAAFDTLHPEKRPASLDAFTRRGKSYRTSLGFEPVKTTVRAWEENGDEAIVHVVIRGAASAQHFRDGVTLKRSGDDWKIVLPASFAQPR